MNLYILQNSDPFTNNKSFFLIWACEWLLFNASSTMFQLYHGENKLIFSWDDNEVCLLPYDHGHNGPFIHIWKYDKF